MSKMIDALKYAKQCLEMVEWEDELKRDPIKLIDEALAEIDGRFDVTDILNSILNEVNRAESKHPNWPQDKIYGAAIIAEENGELMRAAVQFELEGGDISAVKEEAIQTAATCIRLLKNIENA